eukprot:4027399-Alexandrium_andersonii.AAC.1
MHRRDVKYPRALVQVLVNQQSQSPPNIRSGAPSTSSAGSWLQCCSVRSRIAMVGTSCARVHLALPNRLRQGRPMPAKPSTRCPAYLRRIRNAGWRS